MATDTSGDGEHEADFATDMADEVGEWSELGKRLLLASPEKFDELLEAMRKIVDAQETIARYDWQLVFRARPTKRYLA